MRKSKLTGNPVSSLNKTGIIFFTRTRNCEARNKKWHPSHAKNLQIANYLIEGTKSVLHKSVFDVMIIDETKQRGATFGEKIVSAFEDVFEQGYSNLILVGNDSVGLNEQYISSSVEHLTSNPLVFGATDDNGVYLIGFQKSFFDRNRKLIANLSWRTNRLSNEVSNLGCDMGEALLPVLSDLNTNSDILNLLKSTYRFSAFALELRAIVHGNSKVDERAVDTSYSFLYNSENALRGPPSIPFQ